MQNTIDIEYNAPFLLFNGHLQTIFPALFRRPAIIKPYVRERIVTPDDDFLDLDWIKQGSDSLVLLTHGLEGDSSRPYMIGMANQLYKNGFDILSWNFRGCSGIINKQKRMYHSGATVDLAYVVNHASKSYQKIYLIGFSLGGNLTLKYLGENNVNNSVQKAIVYSVPLDLWSGAKQLTKPSNRLYEIRFLRSLFKKVKLKNEQFPETINLSLLKSIKHVIDFDDCYTAPIHGFKDALDYYQQCSSRYFIKNIDRPTIIINAKNDPFLSTEILNRNIIEKNLNVSYLITKSGGHCGFPSFSKTYWSENVASSFFQND